MRKILTLILLFFALFLIFGGNVNAQTVPGAPTVLVEYPECEGDSCSFVQASCSWTAISDATSYTYTVTEVDTGAQIQSATVDASTLKVVFPITQERTYKCDVFATNATGSGSAGTYSLLCSAEGLIDTTPTATTAPTTPLPTKPPIESPGGFETTALILGGVALVIVGGLVLMFL